MAEEVIVVEWKVEGEKVSHDLLLFVPACEVQNCLLVDVLMPDIPALLDQIVQSLQTGFLIVYLNGPKEHILPLMVDTLHKFPWSGVVKDSPRDVVASMLIDHLLEQKHHFFWLTH